MKGWGIAALGALLEIAWLAAVATDHNATLALSESLDALGTAAALNERIIDAAVLLPLFGAGALFAVQVRRHPPAGGLARRLAVAFPVVTALLLAAAFLPLRDIVLYRFVAVEEGVLYRSGQTSEATLERLLRRHGIRTLLYLRERGEVRERERALAERLGVDFQRVPPWDYGWGFRRFLRVMDDPDNHPVLIHCHYGIARTGVLTAVYRMEYQGWDNARAVREARLISGFGGFGVDSIKRDFLLSYVPKHAAHNRRK